MSTIKETLREWSGVIAFIAVVLLLTMWMFHDNQRQNDVDTRQRQIIAALAEENNDAIIANGDFQTCVWTSIVKPRVVGHQHRAVRAINHCADKYLEEKK